MNSVITVVAFGCFGGIAGDLLSVATELKQGRRLVQSRRGTGLLVGMAVSGIVSGIMVWAYALGYEMRNPVLAVQLGASTPLLLERFAKLVPPLSSGDVDAPDLGAGPAQTPALGPPLLERIRQFLAIAE